MAQPAIENLDDALLNCKADFPVLDQTVNGKPLVFLDSAASSQRPQSVIDAVVQYETHDHANVHRGVHTLSQRATDAFEGAREKVRSFIHATSVKEIVFTRGTTEAINLVAESFLGPKLQPGSEILLTELEHHANIVPWKQLADRTGASLVVVPVSVTGDVDPADFEKRLSPKTALAAFAYVSNALGTVLPVRDLLAAAQRAGVPTLVDGAQAVPHLNVDVQALGCDFFAFSAHKMYGPTGIGVLYAKESILEKMPPWQGGGDMILDVSFEHIQYNELPHRFEAGTPNMSGAVGLGAAIDYLQHVGLDAVASHEDALLTYGTNALGNIDGLRLIGTAQQKASVLSFALGDIHPHDIGTILDHQGVAIRTGHHCAMPLMKTMGLPGTARASLGVYNQPEDIDALVAGLQICQEMLG